MSALESVLKLVQQWEPGVQPTELKYRDSLVAFIRDNLKDSKIETEYRHRGTTVDIYVKKPGFLSSSEVFVELKRDLKQKAQLDRLVGQIASIGPDKSAIIVVLCGETHPALVTRFKEIFKLTDTLVFDISMWNGTGIIVQVKNPEKKKSKAVAKSFWW
jgi:hypothetical protein